MDYNKKVIKSLTLEGLGTLGFKAIVVVFTCLSNWPELKKDQTTLIVSRLTILQTFLKKPILNLYGSGFLLSLKEKRTF
jgi:hypothetical protein